MALELANNYTIAKTAVNNTYSSFATVGRSKTAALTRDEVISDEGESPESELSGADPIWKGTTSLVREKPSAPTASFLPSPTSVMFDCAAAEAEEAIRKAVSVLRTPMPATTRECCLRLTKSRTRNPTNEICKLNCGQLGSTGSPTPNDVISQPCQAEHKILPYAPQSGGRHPPNAVPPTCKTQFHFKSKPAARNVRIPVRVQRQNAQETQTVGVSTRTYSIFSQSRPAADIATPSKLPECGPKTNRFNPPSTSGLTMGIGKNKALHASTSHTEVRTYENVQGQVNVPS
jgi:hypothetical protein